MFSRLGQTLASFQEAWQNGQLQFEHAGYFRFWPEALLVISALVIFPLLVKYWWLMRSRRRGTAPDFLEGLASRPFDVLWSLVFTAAGMLVLLTLLGPVWQRTHQVPEKAAIKVVVAMDGSASSLAMIREKSNLSRWEAMRSAVHQVFRKLPHDRKGFFVFAKDIVAQSSLLTTDYERILKPEIDDISEWFLAEVGEGTNFAAAIRGCFKQLAVDSSDGVCIILSDGEQQGSEKKLKSDLISALKELRAGLYDTGLKISFYIVPVGDPNAAMKIPRRDFDGNITGFVCCRVVRGPDGALIETREFIETRPDYSFLNGVAGFIGGKFVPLEKGDELIEAMQETIEQERKVIAYHTRIMREDLSWAGFLLLIPGLLFLVLFWK